MGREQHDSSNPECMSTLRINNEYWNLGQNTKSKRMSITKSLEVRALGDTPSLEEDLTITLKDALVCSRNL
jgi:hypothetical protein